MDKKTFSILRIIAVAIVSISVSYFINMGNWYVPVITVAISWAFLYFMRKKVKQVIADERDYMIAGKASQIAMHTYLLLSVIAGLVLYSLGLGDKEGILFGTATTLLYSACFLMLLYAILFKIFEKKNDRN
jgi:uncharacterized membrane protein